MPKPYDDGQGWMRTEPGVLEPMWPYNPILPMSVINLDSSGSEEKDKGEKQEADKADSYAIDKSDDEF